MFALPFILVISSALNDNWRLKLRSIFFDRESPISKIISFQIKSMLSVESNKVLVVLKSISLPHELSIPNS